MSTQESLTTPKPMSDTGRAFVLLAQDLGANVTRETARDWRAVVELGDVMDLVLDNSTDYRTGLEYHERLACRIGEADPDYFSVRNPELRQQLAGAVVTPDSQAAGTSVSLAVQQLRYYTERFAGWPEKRQNRHLLGIHGMRDSSVERRSTAEVDELCDVRTREARLGNTLMHIYPEDDANVAFHDYLDLAMPRVFFWDDACDLPRDVQKGLTRVPATIGNRVRLLRAATENLPNLIRPIEPHTFYHIGKVVGAILINRLVRS